MKKVKDWGSGVPRYRLWFVKGRWVGITDDDKKEDGGDAAMKEITATEGADLRVPAVGQFHDAP